MTEEQLLVDCLRRLNRTQVPYLVTGSMASNYWGIPRTTHDLDFVIQLSAGAIPRLVAVFAGDFHIDEDAIRTAFRPPHQFNAIDTRSALKVDFWILRTEPFETEMFRRRIAVNLFGESAWIASAEDVLLHKLYWNQITPSERQLGDAAGIFAVQRDALDFEYLRRWGSELRVADTLASILTGEIRPKRT